MEILCKNNDPNQIIGLRARTLRNRQNLTLQRVAEAAEISRSHLSRFERGEKTLSVASLIRLAKALNSSLGALTGEQAQEDDFHLARAGAQKRIVDEGCNFEILSGPFGGSRHNTLLLELTRDAVRAPRAQHGGRELLFVISGSTLLRLPQKEIELNFGDYVEFAGHLPHELTSISDHSVVLLTVVEEKV